tara:strand:- start:542 stop:1150 length:609 start_codon:yes stop_codon:yes gene_type:complete
MQTFFTFLTENYLNALSADVEIKELWADRVWNLLQNSYKDIGGIKGKGFVNKQDMIDNIPMWKMAKQGEKLVAVIMYKDKGGRKSVAMGSDGSDKSKLVVAEMMKQEFKRSFGEKSKAALGTMMKNTQWDILSAFVLTPPEVESTIRKDIIPIKDIPYADWPEDAIFTINKYPQLVDYGYTRIIGGGPVFKVMIGTRNKSLV